MCYYILILGLELASNQLKEGYIEYLIKWYIEQPLAPNEAGMNSISREDAYIDLAVHLGEEVDKEWRNSDRETIMKIKHLQLQNIDIDNIWTPINSVVIVRGIAGIGKSTMIQRYVLKWAKNEILTGENKDDEKIDFLFFFECRELNTLRNIQSFEELLQHKHSQIFEYTTFKELKNIAGRIMIVVDGLDELQGIYTNTPKIQQPSNCMTELVRNMIDTNSSYSFKGHKTVVCGRPKACGFVKQQLSRKLKITTIEVCGFSQTKVYQYIDIFFKHNREKAITVKHLIQNRNLRVMSSVPIFLWVICLLHSEESANFEIEINNVTELYFYGLLTFLKNHLRGCDSNIEIHNLADLVNTEEFGNIVFWLCKLSVETYMTHKVVFTDDDINTSSNSSLHLEQTGLVAKYPAGRFTVDTYQFRHLVFQEFLCALYLCLVKGVNRYTTNRELSSCTPTILGIHALLERKTNLLFMAFYQKLTTIYVNSKTLKDTFSAPYNEYKYNQFIKKKLYQSKALQKYVQRKENGKIIFYCNTLDNNFMEIIGNIKETGYSIDIETLNAVKDAEISVISDVYKRDVIVTFLKALNVQRIHYLHLLNHDVSFQQIDDELFKMRFEDKILNLNIIIRITDRSTRYTSMPFFFEVREDHLYFYTYSMKGSLPITLKDATKNFSLYINDGDRHFEDEPGFVGDLVEYVLSQNGEKKMNVTDHSMDFEPGVVWKSVEKLFGMEKLFNECITVNGKEPLSQYGY